jgi:hypothetical protein
MTRPVRLRFFLMLSAGLLAAGAVAGCSSPAPPTPTTPSVTPSTPATTTEASPTASADAPDVAGNVLIADQFNNRVIEVAKSGAIVWTFGTGSSKAGSDTIVAPNDAERIPGGLTLMSGTGAPPKTPGYPAKGAVDSRVMVVDASGNITWQYGVAGKSGSKAGMLNAPVDATYLSDGSVLITDQGNQRVILVSAAKKILWQYGKTGVAGAGAGQLNNPNSATMLSNGDVLISDESNNRVIEVSKANKIVWTYGSPKATKTLNAPAFASRLDNGDTLISDSANNRVVEVSMAKKVVWSYVTNKRTGSVKAPTPTRAMRLTDGSTLISDQFNHQVISVDASGSIVWSYGQIGVAGNAAGQLNAPYDAKSIGDYTGLPTP